MKHQIISETILELWLERELFETVEKIHQSFFEGQPLVRRKLTIESLKTVQIVMQYQFAWQLPKNKKLFKPFVDMDLEPYTHVFIYREF